MIAFMITLCVIIKPQKLFVCGLEGSTKVRCLCLYSFFLPGEVLNLSQWAQKGDKKKGNDANHAQIGLGIIILVNYSVEMFFE